MNRMQDASTGQAKPAPGGAEQALQTLLAQCEPMSELPPQYLRAVAAATRLAKRVAGDVLVRRDTPETAYYFLVSGAVSVRRPGGNLATLLEADAGPLRAALYTPGDPVEIVVTRDATLLQVPRDVVQRQLGLAASGAPDAGQEVNYLDDWHQLDGLERALSFGVLAHLPVTNVQAIVSRMAEVEAAPGEIVFVQGAPADSFYIVKSGTAEVCRLTQEGDSTRLTVKVPGDSFGDEALIIDGVRNATVRMLTAGKLLRLARQDFVKLIQEPLKCPVSLQTAEDLVAQGACWIDLREPEVFAREALPGALNVPLSLLRNKRNTLDASRTYVTYSDDLKANELGCYLLAERGMTCYFLAELIPHFAVLTTLSEPPGTLVLEPEIVTPVAESGREERDPTDTLIRAAPPEVPTVLLRQLIEAERKRFDRLLAERTAELKRSAERQMNEKIAATDRQLRAQVQNRLAQVKQQQEALLTEARKLQARELALEAKAAELDTARRAFEQEKATLRADLGLSTVL